MTKVIAVMSMSLDGYVADADDGVAEVFDWYFAGDVEVPTASGESGMNQGLLCPNQEAASVNGQPASLSCRCVRCLL